MSEYTCPNCKNKTFKIIGDSDDENSKLYGYKVWKFKCLNCGEEIENSNYSYLLATFNKTQKEAEGILKEFSQDANLLKTSMEKLIGVKKNTGDLENILKKLKFIYLEEKTDLINSLNSLAILIKSNLPNGILGELYGNKNENSIDIKLKDQNEICKGNIKISRQENNYMEVEIKVGRKKLETMVIEKPFRIIQILLRINEVFNYTI